MESTNMGSPVAEDPGTKELEEMVDFVIAVANGAGKMLEDGKITPADAAYFIGALVAAPAAFGGMQEIPEEVKNLDGAKLGALKEHFDQKFDIPQDEVEVIVEDALEIGVRLFNLVQLVRGTL